MGHNLVVGEREHEGNVDVDPFANERLDGGDALRRGGHLDHYIGAGQRLPQASGLRNRAGRVVGQAGRDLQADKPIRTFRFLMHGPQEVSRPLDVLDRQRLEERCGAGVRVLSEPRTQGGVVVGAARDGFFKDGRVAGDAAQPVLLDQALQFAAGEQAAADVVQPNRLSVFQ